MKEELENLGSAIQELGKVTLKELQEELSDLIPHSKETDIFYGEFDDEELNDFGEYIIDAINDAKLKGGSYIITVKHIQD